MSQASAVCGRQERLYVFDGFAGWDPDYRYKAEDCASKLRLEHVCCSGLFGVVCLSNMSHYSRLLVSILFRQLNSGA